MELSPQAVAATTFKLVKKGYDPDEVNAFKSQVASSIEAAQNQAAAMEARARAAVAKLQELSQQVSSAPAEAPPAPSTATDEGVISRTLLLAQRTADATLADANAEAEALRAEARLEAANAIETARAAANQLLDEARSEARRSADQERTRAEGEVQALIAKREFLLADVEHLEQFASLQRDRLRETATAIADVANGPTLADIRRPLLSAAAEGGGNGDDSGALPAPSVDELPVEDAPAPISASPAPSLPVVDVQQVWQQADEPVETPAKEADVDDRPAPDHDDTPAFTNGRPNGGLFRITGDDAQ